MVKYQDDFSEIQPDESSFAPAGGYFSILKNLWIMNILAEKEGDQHKQWLSLFMIYRYIIGYWNVEERKTVKNRFFSVLQQLDQLDKEMANNLPKQNTTRYTTQFKLWELAEEISLKQHEHNLYTPIREKGSDIYN